MSPDPDTSDHSAAKSEDFKNLPRSSRDWVTFFASLSTLGGLALGFWDRVSKQESRSVILIGAIVAFAAGVLSILWRQLLRRLEPRSSFTRPHVLNIGRRYLLGRTQDIDNLVGRLRNTPLVFLVSESGAGKTALLTQGLSEKFPLESPFLPVYVDHWGSDWAEGPRQTIALALYEALGDTWRKQLGLSGLITPGQALKTVGRIYDDLGKVPVLLFDQFDDYYLEHRTLFICGPERHILDPSQLTQQNPFWHELVELLSAHKVRCLFAVREEEQLALDSIRFPGLKTDSYPLERLGQDHARELLDKVAREAGLRHPEGGFVALRKRLMADLGGQENLVLPAQMKLALLGLARLESLTTRSYIKAGGLPGIEALALEHEVARAARLAACDPAELRPLLLALVDTKTQTTRPRTERELLQILPVSRRDPAKLALALKRLGDADIVRRSYAGESDDALWQLDHAYLCRTLTEIDRRAQHWQTFLDTAAEAFATAPSPFRRWLALLRPSIQLRIGYERLRRRVVYGHASAFALASTLRFLFNPLVISVAIAFLTYLALGRQTSPRIINRDVPPPDLSGPAVCWYNDSGKRASAPPDNFYQVSVGGSETCARKSDNSVVCWGDDPLGQAPRHIPGSYSQVNAGGSHTCGLKTDSSVYCWGNNDRHQCEPPPGGTYLQVSAGQFHSCGITLKRSIACWGDSTVPAPGGRYIQVSAAIGNGSPHSCGVTTEKTAVCWDNHTGQHSPVPKGQYRAVSATETQTCGLQTDGLVTCWKSDTGAPLELPGQFQHVSVGGAQSCGLTQGGSIVCWNTDGSIKPVPAFLEGSYLHVAVGPTRSCALKKPS